MGFSCRSRTPFGHHKKFVISIGLIAMMVIAVGYVFAQSSGSEADGKPEPLDGVFYSQVQQVRGELSLTNRDLAAIGCSQAQTQQVLLAVRDWCEQNQQALLAAHQRILVSKSALRSAMRDVHVGVDGALASNDLASARMSLQRAMQQQAQLLDQLSWQVESVLGFDQQQRWQTARKQRDLPGEYQYVAGLGGQDVKQLRSTGGQRLLTSEMRSSVASHELDAVRERITSHMEGVIRADTEVLPAPIDREIEAEVEVEATKEQ